MKLIFSILILIAVCFSFSKNIFKISKYQTIDTNIVCGIEGNAKTSRLQELNKLKNRITFPQEKDFDKNITLTKMLAPDDDEDRWSNDKAARIFGYVSEVKSGGLETCNCKDQNQKDTHIEIVVDPMSATSNKSIVLEVTPRIREILNKQGIDWSTKTLRTKLLGRWVEFEGWLLFDSEHKNAAENTNPGRERNWRASAWEIHPITSIRLTDRFGK